MTEADAPQCARCSGRPRNARTSPAWQLLPIRIRGATPRWRCSVQVAGLVEARHERVVSADAEPAAGIAVGETADEDVVAHAGDDPCRALVVRLAEIGGPPVHA